MESYASLPLENLWGGVELKSGGSLAHQQPPSMVPSLPSLPWQAAGEPVRFVLVAPLPAEFLLSPLRVSPFSPSLGAVLSGPRDVSGPVRQMDLSERRAEVGSSSAREEPAPLARSGDAQSQRLRRAAVAGVAASRRAAKAGHRSRARRRAAGVGRPLLLLARRRGGQSAQPRSRQLVA